jgi:nucleolar protein 9
MRQILIQRADEAPGETPAPSDYLGTLLRDPTASHLLETLVRRAPPAVFALLFRVYCVGRLARLANHPVANFVVAQAIARTPADAFAGVVDELAPEFGKLVGA